MKKLIFIFSMLLSIINLSKSMAQNGRNNNSDFKVPVPVVAPALKPDFGFNIVVPSMPLITVPVDLTPTVMMASYLPQTPAAPQMPIAQRPNKFQSDGKITESNYPRTVILPPLPAIPSNPKVRLAIY